MNLDTNNINQKTLSRAFYEVMIDLAKSDEDPILLGWRDRESQTSRFNVFVENCLESGDRVLDFGCGLSDLYGYSKDNGYDITYTGIDIMPDFIKKSKDRYGDEVRILNTNILYFLEEFEWVFASGVFSVGFTIEEIVEHIEHFSKITTKGICLNLLDKNTFKGDVQVSFDPEEVKDILTNKFKHLTIDFVQGYYPDDYTIIIKHDSNDAKSKKS
jgi:SAM-dependent methyltransferase